MSKYDIFISYRRESFNQANLISTRLKALGYRVFIDVEALNSGKFNEQLLTVIKHCKDVIVVLPPHALDRCTDEHDWVRRELECAIENKKNIIPIMLTGFEWPNPMPKGLEDLYLYQAIAPMPDVYFDMQIKKLQSYLKSKAYYQKRRRWIVGSAIALGVIALLLFIGYLTYTPVAKRLGDSLLLRMEEMMDYEGISNDANTLWTQYTLNYDQAEDSLEQLAQSDKLLKNLSKLENEADILHSRMKENRIQVSEFHIPLFWIHGIEPIDLLLIDQITDTDFDQLTQQFDLYKRIVEDGAQDDMVKQQATIINRDFCRYNVDVFYYSYLQMLTHLPQSVQERFYQLSPKWTNMPKVGLGLADKEYERLINLASEEMDIKLKDFKRIKAQAQSE